MTNLFGITQNLGWMTSLLGVTSGPPPPLLFAACACMRSHFYMSFAHRSERTQGGHDSEIDLAHVMFHPTVCSAAPSPTSRGVRRLLKKISLRESSVTGSTHAFSGDGEAKAAAAVALPVAPSGWYGSIAIPSSYKKYSLAKHPSIAIA